MSDFIKQNKTAVIFLLLGLVLTVASGFYWQTSLKNEPVAQSADTVVLTLPATVSSGQVAAKTEQPAVIEIIEPVNQPASATPVTVGEAHILMVGDKRYEIAMPAGKTVYDSMVALKNRGDFDFKGKGSSGLGFFVEEINGVKNNSFKNIFWFYYINGQSATVGVSNYILKPNDLISWKYEKSQF